MPLGEGFTPRIVALDAARRGAMEPPQGQRGRWPGQVWLDVSRLLWRVFRGRLTGIDRVELAYAEHLLDLAPDRLRLVAHDYAGGFRVLHRRRAEALVRAVRPAWDEGRLGQLSRPALRLFAESVTIAATLRAPAGPGIRPAYLNVSSHPLHWTRPVASLIDRSGCAFVALVHDLIPIEHPEYVPPAWTRQHLQRMHTIGQHADGVIANSVITAAGLRAALPSGKAVLVAPLGVNPAAPLPPVHAGGPQQAPYFLCLGTIEPRKNHLALLNLWRRLALAQGPATPRLVIVGHRGWENEQVIDLLDRCPILRGHVEERGNLPDGEVARLMAGARALLMPSFVEGFGLPVAEALSRGCPVLCSDIPAHHEVGGDAPDYLDPLDGPAWERAVLDYAAPGSARRAAQRRRMTGWTCHSWRQHVAAALGFVDTVAARALPVAAAGDALAPHAAQPVIA